MKVRNAEDHLEGDRADAEGRQLTILQPQEYFAVPTRACRETAERVRQRGPLRHGRERDPRERHADGACRRPSQSAIQV